MDRERFDAITRLAWTSSSRRTALGLLIGAALLGHDLDSAPAKRKGKKKRKKRKKPNGDRPCYPGKRCIPGPGRDNAGCDFSFSTVFRDKNAHGSHLGKASFRGADLSGADLQGADLGGACFVGANLEGATLGASVDLGGAIFCNTRMPDGSIDDSGCDQTTACCPPLEQDCPDAYIECASGADGFGFCTKVVGRIGPVGRCWNSAQCCPCGHPDADYWEAQCNQTFSACNGGCVVNDTGILNCFAACVG